MLFWERTILINLNHSFSKNDFSGHYFIETYLDPNRLGRIKIKELIQNAKSKLVQEKKEAYLEAKILERLDHPNIVKFIEVFRSTKPSPTLNIVMDYADGAF